MYRRLAEQEWARIPALSPGRDDPHKYGKRFRITHIVETLARQTGNVEAVVAVKKDVYLAQLYRMPLFAPWRTRPGVTFWGCSGQGRTPLARSPLASIQVGQRSHVTWRFFVTPGLS
jgi:hypothetical protein